MSRPKNTSKPAGCAHAGKHNRFLYDILYRSNGENSKDSPPVLAALCLKRLSLSGGEWISSVDLENALMSHPQVQEAAVIAIPDAKWQERPLAAVLLKDGASATAEELRDFLAPQFAKWWLPDRIEFVTEIPKTAVGKFRKTALREQFAPQPAVP